MLNCNKLKNYHVANKNKPNKTLNIILLSLIINMWNIYLILDWQM
jgi:hypothetical protein